MIVQTVYPGDVLIWPRNDNAAYLGIDAISLVRFAKAIVRGWLVRKDRIKSYGLVQLAVRGPCVRPIMTTHLEYHKVLFRESAPSASYQLAAEPLCEA